VPPTAVHISSPAVEIEKRQLSTKMHTITTPQNVMLSPFLVKSHDMATKEKDVDVAFMGLLKAMSGLKTPSVDDHSVFDQVKSVKNKHLSAINSIGLPDIQECVDASFEMNHEAEVQAVNGAKTSGEEKAQSKKITKTKKPLRIRTRIERAIAAKNVSEVVRLFEQAKLNDALSDLPLGRVVTILSFHDLRKSFQALKYLTQRSKDQNNLVDLNVYRRVIEGITHTRDMDGIELCELAEELFHHLKESFPKGTTSVIYQHILVPALVCQLAEYKDLRVKRCAKPMVEYMVEEQFPVLNPELYEAILKEAAYERVGHLYLPYHKLLTELVSRGEI
jgi:hypothetical protein